MTLKKIMQKANAAATVRRDDCEQNLNTEMTAAGFVAPDVAQRARMNDLGIGFDDGDLMDGF